MTTTDRDGRGSRAGRRRHRRAAALALGLAALTAVAACGTGDPKAGTTPLFPSDTPSASATPDAEASPANPAPLTGLGVTAKVAARPAVAVAVLDRDGDAPTGLSKADLVYEEFAGSGTRHLVAVYQSQQAKAVGPVDMTRPVDVKLLPVLHPVLAYSGGPLGFVVQVDKAGLEHVNAVSDPGAFSGGEVSTAKVLAEKKGLSAPPNVFSYGSGALGEGAGKATTLRVAVPGQDPQTWRYDPKSHQWRSERGDLTVSAANVVVQRVSYKTVTNKHLAGGTTNTALTIGDGKCVAASRGQHVDCRWIRPNRVKQTNYADSTGAVLTLTPGATWVVLAPPGTKVKASA